MARSTLRPPLFVGVAVLCLFVPAAAHGECTNQPAMQLTGPNAASPITLRGVVLFDLKALSAAMAAGLAGREIVVDCVEIDEVAPRGFWVVVDGQRRQRVFVQPAEGSLIRVRPGKIVNLHGDLRPMVNVAHDPPTVGDAVSDSQLYVYAYTVRPAW